MREAYTQLIEKLDTREYPQLTLTVQLCFILYLLLGQFVVMLVWRPIAPLTRRWRPWVANLVFGVYLLVAQALLFLAWPWLVGLWQTTDNVLLADIVVAVHLGLVVAVVLMLILVPIGGIFAWRWTRNFWLRLAHLLTIEIVAGQAIVGIECPLKTVERELRGGLGYLHPEPGAASEFGRWCNYLLYYPGEPWVFMVIYAVVGLLVLAGWMLLPPRMPWHTAEASAAPAEPAAPSGAETPSRLSADQEEPRFTGLRQ